MIFRDTDNPSPVPVPTGLVVKNGSNSLSSLSSGMPVPVSSICITTLADRARRGAAGAGKGFHRQSPVVAHRLDGVHENVDEHLLDLVPVQFDRGQLPGEMFVQGYLVFGKLMFDQHQRFFDDEYSSPEGPG